GHRQRGQGHRRRSRPIRPGEPGTRSVRALHRRLRGGLIVTDILMPALSPTMEEGTLTKWHIKAGDTVSAGQVIAEIETDKATMEVEAVDEGEVLEILVAEGSENVKVNTPIARLAGEDAAPAPKKAEEAPAEPMTQTEAEAPVAAKAAAAPAARPTADLRDPEI